MRHLLLSSTVLTIGLTLTGCNGMHMGGTTANIADPGPPNALTYAADEVDWQDGPASLEEGAQMAMLEGDASQPGVFTMRLRLPDGFVINPHTHPGVERVTVLDGTFHLGHGSTLDPDAAHAHQPGSYITMPPGHEHFAIAEGDTIIQLTSVGPWEINYIDPADDPRQ